MAKAFRTGFEFVNSKGGILGKMIQYTFLDGQSNSTAFAEKASEWIKGGGNALFGTMNSNDRIAVQQVVDENQHLLFYPSNYEGQECSQNTFYTGAIPN